MKKANLKNLLILIFLIKSGFSFAQNLVPSDFLSSDFHKERRELFRAKMPNNSVAVFFANPVRNRDNDVDYIYHQDPNFSYLSGYNEPHAVLLIFKETQQGAENRYDEVLFVQPRNARAEMWNGRRLGTEGAKNKLGLNMSFDNIAFADFGIDFSKFDKVLFSEFYNDYRDNPSDQGDLYSLIEQFKQKSNYPEGFPMVVLDVESNSQATTSNLDQEMVTQFMKDLRGIKTEEELVLLRKAIDISCVAQAEVMKAMHENMSENEIQGMHEFVFKKYGSEYEGYPSIVGGGNNGCILHYITNNKPEVGKELVLMDLGAEYHGYTADVTRTIPGNGVFSPAQKAIYDLVYKAQDAAINESKAGNTFRSTAMLARSIVNEGLVELGIIDSVNQRHMYFPHGISHHIGLDVHDAGNYDKFEDGMVITVEPGIYIPKGSNCDEKWWDIAVRIEDCILISGDSPELLSDLAPRKSDEIEELMKGTSAFNNFSFPSINQK